MKKNTHFVGLFSLLLLLNTACTTSGWRAPLETRGKSKPTAPATQLLDSYRVKQGDTLYSIAWRSDRDFRTLAKWNNIREPYTIYAGQRLRLNAPAPKPPVKPRHKKAPPKSIEKPTPKPKPVRIDKKDLVWQWPIKGKVAATYKAGDPLRKGIKVLGRVGQTVRAAEAGHVVYSGSGLIGYGRLVIIKHNEKYLSAYGHGRKLLVSEGQQVKKGSKIAELGRANDGRVLLHFEIRRDGKPVDPLGLLPGH